MARIISVTDIPCSCGFLERCAEDPGLPIVFDPSTHEFQIEYPTRHGNGHLIIYHCPSCGGAAPESIRGTLFARVSMEETMRLKELLAEINTLEEATERLGAPDHDIPGGAMSTTPGSDGQPPITSMYRMLIYENLSGTALVQLVDYHKERIGISIQGKYIGSAGT